MDNEDIKQYVDPYDPSPLTSTSCLEESWYCQSILRLLVTGGVDQINMNAVAREMRKYPSAIKQSSGGRAGFLIRVTKEFASRWDKWIYRQMDPANHRPPIPRTVVEIHGVRAWSAIRELAAGEARAGRPAMSEIISRVDVQERSAIAQMIQMTTRREADPVAVMYIWCVARGLRAAVTDPQPHLTADEAEEILTRAIEIHLTDQSVTPTEGRHRRDALPHQGSAQDLAS